MGFKKPSNSGGWQECMRKFVELTQGVTIDKDTWFKVWLMLLEDDWFNQLLRETARSAFAESGLSADLRLDIESEAWRFLARSLGSTPDLNLSKRPDMIGPRFPLWMRKRIENACINGIRKWFPETARLLAAAELGMPQAKNATEDNRAERDRQLDTWLAIEQLPEPCQTVFMLLMGGSTLEKIALKLDLSYWKVYREERKGYALLKKLLRDYGPDCDNSE